MPFPNCPDLDDFNPRPLAGATSENLSLFMIFAYFNPRPLAGATPQLGGLHHSTQFQSTPPCGGDCSGIFSPTDTKISIHAPLRGRLCAVGQVFQHIDFNPRPLAGATFSRCTIPAAAWRFQSTPPCGGDGPLRFPVFVCCISIHAPLRGRLKLG